MPSGFSQRAAGDSNSVFVASGFSRKAAHSAATVTTRYVTLAYGDGADVYSQATMLLVSLVAYSPAPRELLVVTDRPERFSWFGTAIRVVSLDRRQLDAWRGAPPISMRIKLEVLRANWPEEGAIAFVDADVLAHESLAPFEARLHAGDVFMHKHEYDFGRSKRRGNRALWNELRGRSFAGWEVRSGDAMWNSGVLAAPAADRALFDQMLQFYDAMVAAGGRHFATEQLVEGVVLGRTGRLRPAAGWFTHYWGNKPAHTAAINARLEAGRAEGLSVEEFAARYREDPIDLPSEVRLTAREKVARWFSRLR